MSLATVLWLEMMRTGTRVGVATAEGFARRAPEPTPQRIGRSGGRSDGGGRGGARGAGGAGGEKKCSPCEKAAREAAARFKRGR